MRFPFIDHERFQLVRELGEGAYGVSFLVEDAKRDGEQVVLVLIERDFPEDLEIFKREIESLARLTHPNLVPYFGPFVEDGHIGYTRAFVEGKDLRDFWSTASPGKDNALDLELDFGPAEKTSLPGEEGDELEEGVVPASAYAAQRANQGRDVVHTPLDLHSLEVERELADLSDESDEVGEIISQITRPNKAIERKKSLEERLIELKDHLPELLSGLEHLHRFKRAHGALHPGCIIRDEENSRWQIADFGLPSLMSSASNEDTTPPLSTDAARSRWRQRRAWVYRAPELFEGRPASPAADIYSLGCVLYEIFAERPPFDGMIDDLGARHIEEIPVSLLELQPRCPSSWAQLIDEMLDKSPEYRPTLDALEDALDYLEDEPSSLPPSFIPLPAKLSGREEILEDLLARAEHAERSRELSTIVLTGEEGVGKHHLFEHVCATLSRRGWVILRGRCYEDHAEPYQGWRAMILQLLELFNHLPPALAVELGELRRLAASIFPELSPNPDRSEQTEALQRLEATSALRKLIGALSMRRPVLLGFDELHLAQRDALELLHDFRSGNDAFRGMILATSSMSAKELFPSRDRENVPSITTRYMNSDEARDYLETIAREEELDVFSPMLEEHQTHHPLLLKELLYEVQRRWITAKPEDARALLEKPLTEKNTLGALDRLFSQRLERVSGEALMLLRVLALTAGPTSLAVLAHTQDQVLDSLGDEPSEVSASETALTRLCAMRLAKRLPSGRRSLPSYRIANDLIRKQVLGGMPQAELVQLCKALAKVVEGTSAHAHARKFEYLRLANLSEEPAEHIEPALRDARKHLAFGRASELQRWRIEHTDPSSLTPAEWRAQRALLAEFEASTGRHEVAAKLLKEIAEELEAGLERTEALGDEAEAWFYAGNLPEAERALEEALRYFGERYSASHRSDVFTGVRERFERLRLGGVTPLGNLEDKVLTGEAGSKQRIYRLMLRTKNLLNSTQAPRIQRRLEDLGRKHGDRRTCADAYLHRAQILLSLDRPSAFRQAPALLDAAEQVYEALEDQEHMTLVLVARADLAAMQGDPKRATELYKEADRRWRISSNHTRLARTSLDAHRGMLAIELGRLDLANRWLEALFHEERHLEPARLAGHKLAAEVALLQGRPNAAQYHIEQVQARLAKKTASTLELWTISAQTRHNLAVGRPEVAIGQLEVHFERLHEQGFLRFPTAEAVLLRSLGWALSAQLEREWAFDAARRRELMRKLQATTRRLEKLSIPQQTQERSQAERLRARQEWLQGRPRRALKILDDAVKDPTHIPGALEQAKFAEARSLLLEELERDGGADLREQANKMYDLLGICSPLILEGWPIPERFCALTADEH